MSLRHNHRQVRPRKSGFTLFEVLVALGLSVVLMAMIGFAIQFYAEQLNVRDSEARRTQLARSILRMIAEDLQACVYPQEFDAGALAEVLASSATGAVAGVSSSSADASSDEAITVEEADTSVDATAISGSLASTLRPGLIGNQFQLQFDISRLPRLEEYLPMLTNPTDVGIEDLPSDVKTVAYFVQQTGLTGVGDNIQAISEGAAASFDTQGGLVRRSLSRELTRYASESGDINRLNQTGDVIAPEVLQIEFAYFDGTQWLFEWNSDVNKSLPMAVQIRIQLKKGDSTLDANAPTTIGLATASDVASQADVYDLMVRLPMAKIVSTDEMAEAGLSSNLLDE